MHRIPTCQTNYAQKTHLLNRLCTDYQLDQQIMQRILTSYTNYAQNIHLLNKLCIEYLLDQY